MTPFFTVKPYNNSYSFNRFRIISLTTPAYFLFHGHVSPQPFLPPVVSSVEYPSLVSRSCPRVLTSTTFTGTEDLDGFTVYPVGRVSYARPPHPVIKPVILLGSSDLLYPWTSGDHPDIPEHNLLDLQTHPNPEYPGGFFQEVGTGPSVGELDET